MTEKNDKKWHESIEDFAQFCLINKFVSKIVSFVIQFIVQIDLQAHRNRWTFAVIRFSGISFDFNLIEPSDWRVFFTWTK